MRKVISQGLAMPLDILHEFTDSKAISKLDIGDEVTDLIGVTKYEAPVNGKSASKGYWPFYLPKTDEIRVQSAPEALEEMQGKVLCVTIKLDGCSCTFSHKDGEFEVCSRNWALKDMTDNPEFKDDRWWAMANKLSMEERLAKMGNYAIQGELCGPGIQGNKLGLSELDFFVFNVYSIDEQRYLDHEDVVNFCDAIDLNMVPVLFDAVQFNRPGEDGFELTQEKLLKLAEGKYEGTTNEREGIVIRPVVETYSEALEGRLSLKAISNRFLLKGGD
jgi:RNA ligase (TIGR02306 family)